MNLERRYSARDNFLDGARVLFYTFIPGGDYLELQSRARRGEVRDEDFGSEFRRAFVGDSIKVGIYSLLAASCLACLLQ